MSGDEPAEDHGRPRRGLWAAVFVLIVLLGIVATVASMLVPDPLGG